MIIFDAKTEVEFIQKVVKTEQQKYPNQSKIVA